MNKILVYCFALAAGLVAILYFLPTKQKETSADPEATEASTSTASNQAFLLNRADSLRELLSQIGDAASREAMGKTAISIYEQILKEEPGNLDAKAGMGFCLALATPQPMSGIMMLREVVKTDPNHENGQLFLGLLSLQSGQLDKAIERFQKVLVLDSQNNNVLLLLGRTYAENGNPKKAVETFQLLKSQTKDAAMIQEADEWIAKLESAS